MKDTHIEQVRMYFRLKKIKVHAFGDVFVSYFIMKMKSNFEKYIRV